MYFLLFVLLLYVWWFYDEALEKLAIMLLDPPKILGRTADGTALHLRVTLEGKNYDIWVPYSRSDKVAMAKIKFYADGHSLYLLPGCLPRYSVENLGYQSLLVCRGKKEHEFKKADIISSDVFDLISNEPKKKVSES